MNNKTREKPWLTAILCAVIVLACALAVSLRFRPFVNYDTCAIQMLLNGSLTDNPDSRILFMNILTSHFLVFLYKACPAIEWCSAFLLFSYLFSFWALLFRVMTLLNDRPQTVRLACCGCAALLFLFLFLWDLIEISFTGCSVAAGFSLLVYIISARRFDFQDFAIVLLLTVLCCGIRTPVMKAVMPYIFLFFGVKWIRKEFAASDLATLSAICLVLLTCHVADKLAYRNEYGDMKKLNRFRSQIQDYEGLPAYQNSKELYDSLEMDEIKYGILRLSWGLSEDFNENVLQTIKEYNRSNIDRIRRARELFTRTFGVHYHYILWFVEAVFLCAAVSVSLRGRKHGNLVYLLLVLAAGAGELLYLAYGGRLPKRVSCIALYGTIAVCLGLVLGEAREQRIFPTKRRLGLACAALALLLVLGMHGNLAACKPDIELDRTWGRMLHYFMKHPENTYYANCTYNEPLGLLTQRTKNFKKIGGWLSETPGWRTALQQDYPTIWDAIAYRDDLRFCMDEGSMDILVYYLNQQGYCSEANFEADPLDNAKYLIWSIETEGHQMDAEEESPS